MNARRWNELHWVGGLALAAVCGALAWCYLIGQTESDRFGVITFYGWPLCCSMQMTSSGGVSMHVDLFAWVVDVAVLMAVAISTAVVGRRFAPWQGRWQIRLGPLLGIVGTLGVVARLLALDQTIGLPGPDGWRELSQYLRVTDYPAAVYVAILFGVGCGVYAAGWLALWVAGVVWGIAKRRLRTPKLNSPSADF